ncbi:hypothetical protein BASA81_000761 [Batrachochytrium salamandrivorans]|nr:hypothetical protein BASA81_000761 [Batrachochytrium salamandrivorans]
MDEEEELMRDAADFFEGGEEDYPYEEEEEIKSPLLPPVLKPTPIARQRPAVAAPPPSAKYDKYFSKQAQLGKRQVLITLANGTSCFCDLRTEQTAATTAAPLCTPKQISVETFQRIESQVEFQLLNPSSPEPELPEQPPTKPRPRQEKPQPPLVQRYAPKRFVDLLSHEKKNRDALKWLKSWDPKALRELAATSAELGGGGKKPPFHAKILLLTGPAGTGKTTLAHVIAKHCNYRVVEINASDDRTAQSLKHHLENVTETQAEVFDTATAQDHVRKSLLVLDEVDGVLDGVPLLVQYANDKTKLRPIICTCNDAFLPALRPLRQVALTLSINLPARSRLVKRLKEVLLELGTKPVPGALELLCERMEDDIRASLNALDFWLNSTSERAALGELTRQSILSLPAFAKDSSRDLWQVWREILSVAAAAKPGQQQPRDLAETAQHIFSLDVDMVVDGVHENFPAMRYVDSNFTKTFQACEWLTFVDQIQHRVRQEMDFSFDAYLPAACLGVGHSLGASVALPQQRKFQFPTHARKHRQQLQRNQDTLRDAGLDRDSAQALAGLVFPGKIRPGVPHQHLLPQERTELERIAALSQEYKLRWKEAESGFGKWALDPAIADLAVFAGLESQPEFVLHSADLARSVNSFTKKRSGGDQVQPPQSRKSQRLEQDPAANDVFAAAAAGAANPGDKEQEEKPQPRRDFFGRVLAIQPQHTMQAKQARNDFVFKFNEGFTDAVRRSLKMKDFL